MDLVTSKPKLTSIQLIIQMILQLLYLKKPQETVKIQNLLLSLMKFTEEIKIKDFSTIFDKNN